MIHSAMNSTNEGKIKQEIVDTLKEGQNALSTKDVALRLDRSWHSIQTNCLRLQVEGKVEGFRAGRVNLWQMPRQNN
ncbi:MAG: hypothetical protein V1660_02675 [archaeon]